MLIPGNRNIARIMIDGVCRPKVMITQNASIPKTKNKIESAWTKSIAGIKLTIRMAQA